jgi:hypothetical protein
MGAPNWKDNVALATSLLAMAISIATWLDSRQQARIAAGQARAAVQVQNVRLVEPLSKASFVRLELRIKSFGGTSAVKVSAAMEYNTTMPHAKGGLNSPLQVLPLAPGMERIVVLQSNRRAGLTPWPHPNQSRPERVFFFGTLSFVDETTGRSGHDDFCYQIPIRTDADLDRLDLEPCGSLRYESSSLSLLLLGPVSDQTRRSR